MTPPSRIERAAETVRSVVFVLYDGVSLLDVAGALTVLRCASDLADGYTLSTAGLEGPVQSFEGLTLVPDVTLASLRAPIDTLIVPGWGAPPQAPSPPLLAEIATLAASARRVVGICTGAVVLADAGVLRGRRVTTHWAATRLLSTAHPDLRVDVASLFVRDGNVWTSAGVTAGIDLALQLVEDDFDHDVARRIAAWIVHVRRAGGQLQLAPASQGERSRRAALRKLIAWVREHLTEELTLDRLASEVGMSRRTLTRAFATELGCTVGELIERVRVEEATRLLELTDRPIKRIAADVGFGTTHRLAAAFRRCRGTTPSTYREGHR